MRSTYPLLLAGAAALTALIASLTSASLTAAPQDDEPGEGRRRATLPAVPSPDPRLVELQGAWHLQRVESPSAREQSFRHSGMMLIADGYLSIELHLGMLEVERTRMFETYFQSGFHRVELDPFGQLALTSVLGAEVDESGTLNFEEPGQRRLYGFELVDERLVLTNLQRQARLHFQRVRHTPPPRDIHGREIRTRPGAPDED